MAEIIQDGKGRGYKAGVDKDGNLMVAAIDEDVLTYVSREKQQAFELHPPTFALAAAAGYTPIVWMKNTSSDKHVYIVNVRISHNGGNTTKTCDGGFRIYRNMGIPTGNMTMGKFGISDGPHNLNLSSNKEPPLDFRFWDSTGTTGMALTNNDFGEQLTCGLLCQGTLQIQYNGALIIPPGFVIGGSVKSDEDGKGSMVITGFYL